MYTELTVTSDTNGAIVFHGRMDNGDSWHKALDPKDAVQVWRRMMGETEEEMHITSPHLDVKYDEHGETWIFSDKEVLCVLGPDECMLVAWAIEKAGGIALYNGPIIPGPPKEKIPEVWVLSWRRMLTGDTAGEGTELIGGSERIYMTRGGAMSDLPDLLKGLVKDSHPEGHFGPDEDGLGETVEEIMNEESNNGHPGKWLYDGSTQSFEVELSWIPVRP